MRMENVFFSYITDGRQDKEVISAMDLSVKKGEILAILGPSGCGKSTLIKLLAGFLRPDGGSVYHRDAPVGKPFREGQMIFQDTNQLLPWLTVGENVCFPDNIKRSDQAGIRKLLQKVGLESSINSYPHELSGGMKQKCALARALFTSPEILFMDEPFVSLDAPSRDSLQNLVLDIWRDSGTTILFVTHDIAEALFLSDRILFLGSDSMACEIMENRLLRPREKWTETFIREEIRYHSRLKSSLDIR